MAKVNENFLKIDREYIFPIIEQKLDEFRRNNPHETLYNLGIGDVSQPLTKTVAKAINLATQEMASRPIGYGPATGYDFLKQAIIETIYKKYEVSLEEVFISDGILSDIADMQELFCHQSVIGLPDPSYPAYIDTNVFAGRAGNLISKQKYSNMIYFACNQETGFKPLPDDRSSQIIYLCSPNNPTGVALTENDLARWVNYAHKQKAIILYDAAYCDFICSKNVPKSIYEIPGAKEVAIEMRSFSKSAGFTGLRCSYSIIPKEIKLLSSHGSESMNRLWKLRQNAKYNGTSYLSQRAAEAALSPQGTKEANMQLTQYQKSAKDLFMGLSSMGYEVCGGIDSPYVWWKIPYGKSSWEFFETLLTRCKVLAVPGIGFGLEGNRFIRLSGFAHSDAVHGALKSIKRL